MAKEFISNSDETFVWEVEMKNQYGKTAKFKATTKMESQQFDSYMIVLEMIKQENKGGFDFLCEFVESVDE